MEIEQYAIGLLTLIICLSTVGTSAIALLFFREIGYGPGATNIAIGLGLTTIAWLGFGLSAQVWAFPGLPERYIIVVISLLIKIMGMVYEATGYWHMYCVAKGWWYTSV